MKHNLKNFTSTELDVKEFVSTGKSGFIGEDVEEFDTTEENIEELTSEQIIEKYYRLTVVELDAWSDLYEKIKIIRDCEGLKNTLIDALVDRGVWDHKEKITSYDSLYG